MVFQRRWRGSFVRLLAASMLLLAVLPIQAGQKSGKTNAEFSNSKQPLPPPLKFVVYGDTRNGHDVHRKLVALILQQKPELVLHTGDLVSRGSSEELWKIYDDITGELRRKIPFYPARGNHDLGGPGYEDRVTASFTSGNKLWYSFDRGNCHFISLAIDTRTPYDPASEQYKWLIKDLTEANKKAVKHIFVFFHVAAYSIGSHGSDFEVQTTLSPVFIKYGVRAVLNGHDHIYYRTRRAGIPYIVTGGGGAPLYNPDPNRGAIEGDKWEKVNHLVVIEVDGSKVTGAALRADGTPIERFTLEP